MRQIERALERVRNQRQGAARADDLPPARPLTGIRRRLDLDHLRRVSLDARELRRRHVILGPERSTAAASFKMLRTRVRRAMEAQGLTTLAVSSPRAGDGKTLIAVNLAFRMAADAGAEVILADFDLRNPSVSALLDLDSALAGVGECLSGQAALEDVCVCPGPERLAILPNTTVYDNSSEVLRSEAMAQLVEDLRGNHLDRIAIFDLPPLLSADDFLAFSRHVDALLLVVREGKTLRSDLVEALESLAGINVIGTVLNKSLGRAEPYY